MDLYIHSPIRLNGLVLNWLTTGRTLPYSCPVIETNGPNLELFFV
jgi:hypothetical protein